MPRIKALLLLAFLSLFLPSASWGAPSDPPSGTVDLTAQRLPLTPLTGPWHFHPGDNPAWSQPSFDDARWATLKPTQDWLSQGYNEQNGLAWFRFRLIVPAHTPSLLLQLPRITRNYQLFADAKLIGQVGNLPPQGSPAVVASPHVFTIPLPPSEGPHLVTLALRVYLSPMFKGIFANSLGAAPYAGEAPAIMRQFALVKASALLSRGGEYTLDIVVAVVALAGLILFLLDRRRQSFYLWLVCFAATQILAIPLALADQHWNFRYTYTVLIAAVLDFGGTAAVAFLVLDLLKLRRSLALLPVLCIFLAEISALSLLFFHLPLLWADALYLLFGTVTSVFLLVILFRGWRAGDSDAAVLVLGYAPSTVISFLIGLSRFLVDCGVPHATDFNPFRVPIMTQPFAIAWDEAATMLFTLCLLVVLVQHFLRASRQRERLSSALQAAHELQYALIPSDLPSLGGLSTQVAYIAAEEVGGDFCQVLPRPDGSLLLVLGDVSGKGLRAAMIGTLCVGALRSFADETIGPSAALDRLNNVVLSTEYAGFVTCLCALVSPEGAVTLANAGHLSPYLNGAEISLDAGLPLGIVAAAEYTETTLNLPNASRLTLLSDGVVEARSATGELLGFDRTSTLSRSTASEIAREAQQYGPKQDDDITVLTLDWNTPVLTPALT